MKAKAKTSTRGGSRAGAGRKPKGDLREKKAWLSTRITQETRDLLQAEADRKGRSLSQVIEKRIKDSFGIQIEPNPYLRALAYLIGQQTRAFPKDWQNDQWYRQVLKIGVMILLNRIIPTTAVEPSEAIKQRFGEWSSSPETLGKMLEFTVNIMMEGVPPDTDLSSSERRELHELHLPTGSLLYAMRDVRRDLGIPYDRDQAAIHLECLKRLRTAQSNTNMPNSMQEKRE